MPIGQDKTRIVITVTKEMHEQLKKAAEQDNRTMTNFIVNILNQNLKEEN